VDVTVEAKHGLMFLDCFSHSRAAHWFHLDTLQSYLWAQFIV
jgi:hypothetical protein